MIDASKRFALLGTIGTFALAAPLAAQQAPATDEEVGGSVIVVTALRRNESIQDVPVSITALGGDDLAQQRLQQVSDLAGTVPNLQASPAGGDGLPIFSLRGISMSDFSVNQQGPVATYFDEVYKGSFSLLPLAMYDLERVEVLRGPQGTLYGKNTTGGAINFISRKPGYETEGYLRLGYGNYDRIDAEGAVQTALGNKAATRIAFTYARADGWFENQLPGEPDPSAVRQYGARASFLVEPTDTLEFVLRLSTSLQNPTNFGVYADPGPAGIGAGVYELFGGESDFRAGLGRREIESNYARRARHRTYGVSLTGTWEMSDALTLTSVTGYDRGKLFIPEDTDGSALKVVEADYRGKGKQFSQDLRLASDFDGPLNFILGGYYGQEIIRAGTTYRYFNDIDVNFDGTIDYNDCLDPNSGFFIACGYSNDYRQKKRSMAVYSDFTFDLTDKLTLRGGLRYTRDKGWLSDFNAKLIGPDGVPLANTVPGDPFDPDATTGIAFTKGIVTGKAGVDFHASDDALIYASYSRGYRSNAFNAQAFISPAELTVAKPEIVDAYEIGLKSQFAGSAVTLNGAAFLYDYKNQQALNVAGGAIQTLVNIPKSRIMGGELELTAEPVDTLRINASVGILDTEIREGTLSGVSLVGNRLPNAPSFSGALGIEWDAIASDSGMLTVGLDGHYASKQYYNLGNTDRIAQKSGGIVNGRLTYRFSGDRYAVSVWGKNLFDRFYHSYAVDLQASLGYDYLHLGDPRTYGVSVEAQF